MEDISARICFLDETEPGALIKMLNPEIHPAQFFSQVKESTKKLLVSEYDGILAPFQDKRDSAFPYPEVKRILDEIVKTSNTRFVVVSGRWTKNLKKVLNLQVQPEIWGSNGLERLMPDGNYDIKEMDEDALKALVMADEWTERMGFSKQCEKKPGSLAIHWRGLDDSMKDEINNKIASRWQKISKGSALTLSSFNEGLELHVPGRGKAGALRTILEEMGRDTVAACLGNNEADEEAFMSIKGRGIGVFVNKELRPTAADFWIKPPHELTEFLSEWMAATTNA